jgi:hypothetical protein
MSALTLTLRLEPGSDPDALLDELANHVQGRARVERYASRVIMFDKYGTAIAWDTCAHCFRHIRTCACPEGPQEPSYITAWRPEADATVARHEPRATTVEEKIENLSAAIDSLTVEETP